MYLSNYVSGGYKRHSNIDFKGYAACPIKNLYMQSDFHEENLDVAEELKAIGKSEGFVVKMQIGTNLYDSFENLKGIFIKLLAGAKSRWAQDNKTFLNTPEGEKILTPRILHLFRPGEDIQVNRLAEDLKMDVKVSESYLEGGNYFLGKKYNGEPYAIIGIRALVYTAELIAMKDLGLKPESLEEYQDNLANKALLNHLEKNKEAFTSQAKKQIACDLNLKPEQIAFISQPEYHLDMKIRPLQYPYILVNDYETMVKELDKIENPSQKAITYLKRFKKRLMQMKETEATQDYVSSEKTVKELTDLGFKVIKAPGIIDKRANFMNAIVHERKNGELVYITTETNFLKNMDVDFNKLFTKFLMENVQSVKRVEFVGGPINSYGKNYIERYLDDPKSGAIHCMAAEEPDFKAWA